MGVKDSSRNMLLSPLQHNQLLYRSLTKFSRNDSKAKVHQKAHIQKNSASDYGIGIWEFSKEHQYLNFVD
jgi:hypothetical protein